MKAAMWFYDVNGVMHVASTSTFTICGIRTNHGVWSAKRKMVVTCLVCLVGGWTRNALP